jgi:hypothetical protein
MFAILDEMREDLGLERRIEAAAELIRIQLAMLWVHLMELDAENLRGYGEPPAELVEYLEPRVRELIEHVDRISRIMKPDRN